jgi:hypothetical protein
MRTKQVPVYDKDGVLQLYAVVPEDARVFEMPGGGAPVICRSQPVSRGVGHLLFEQIKQLAAKAVSVIRG